MNLEYYLKTIIDDNQVDEIVREEGLYENIDNELLRNFFSLAHHEINSLLKYLNSRFSNGHYTADESRILIKWIKIIEDTIYAFKDSETPIEIDKYYFSVLLECKSFLSESYGSEIPIDLAKIKIIEYDPIFNIANSIEISISETKIRSSLKLIGQGSYAKVYKYKDEFYNINFIVKKANNDLDEKELIRFKREFETMKELKSPYIIEVYKYFENTNEYIMEYADIDLYEYIQKNNTKITIQQRINLVNQLMKGFEYIDSKGLLHRDISLKNILIKHYDGVDVLKISDFGLVKMIESNLTSRGTDFKGSLNDVDLEIIGFDNYNIIHETYALTRLIFFIMTGKTNLSNLKDEKYELFLTKGINRELKQRYQSIKELKLAFNQAITY